MPTQQPRRWHEHLPDWILSDPRWQQLTPAAKAIVQAIANGHKRRLRCDRPGCTSCRGSLLDAPGGRHLYQAAGCTARTFWRHIGRLEQVGFVVTVATGSYINGSALPNRYAIPAHPGALADKRRRRAVIQRLRDGSRFRDVHRRADEQMDLFYQPEAPDEASRQMSLATKCHTPRDRMSHPPVTKCHTLHPMVILYENHGHGGCAKRPRGKWHVESSDLATLDARIALYDRWSAGKLIESSEHARIRFLAACEHAVRVGANPPALLSSLVRRGEWLFITQHDEETARRALHRHRYGESAQVPQHATQPTDCGTQHPRGPRLGPDARWMAQWRELNGSLPIYEQLSADPQQARLWPRARFDAAIRELSEVQPC